MSNKNLPAARADKKPRPQLIGKKIRAAIDALVQGEAANITEAAKIAGLSREHLSRQLSRPHIAELLNNKVKRHLAINAAKAGVTKVQLLDSANEMVRDRASTFVLGLAGIKPDEVVTAAGGSQTPGVVIQIVAPQPAVQLPQQPTIIDVTPELIRP